MADYIDREELIKKIVDKQNEPKYQHPGEDYFCGLISAETIIDDMPSVDAVEVVRCKDCKHKYYDFCNKFMQQIDNGIKGHLVTDDDFCKWGEKE